VITISAFASQVFLASQQKTSPQCALASFLLGCLIFEADTLLV